MTGALVVYENPDQVRKDLEQARAQVMEVLPSRVDPERFLRVVSKAVIENPKLMQCTRLSLLSAVHEAAQLGLEPSGLLGSAYLVPYRMRREVGGKWQTVHEAKLIPGYRGLIDLARRSGEIRAIVADVWRWRDAFDYERTRQPDPIRHRPFIPDPTAEAEDRDRGPIVGAYMLAYLTSGYVQPEVMFYDEIEVVRKSSKAADDGPWVTSFSEMARKTVVRRGSKYLPLTPEFERALSLDEEAEREAEGPERSSGQAPRATQMLLDRARRATEGQGASEAPEGDTETSPGASEAPRDSTEEAADQEEQSKPSATDICGDENPELGVCTRAPGHTTGHRNEAGVWPRAKK